MHEHKRRAIARHSKKMQAKSFPKVLCHGLDTIDLQTCKTTRCLCKRRLGKLMFKPQQGALAAEREMRSSFAVKAWNLSGPNSSLNMLNACAICALIFSLFSAVIVTFSKTASQSSNGILQKEAAGCRIPSKKYRSIALEITR